MSELRAAVLRNPRAHVHRRGRSAPVPPGTHLAEPHGAAALSAVLRAWALEGVTRIVVDGGDGTVREVLGALPDAFGDLAVELAVLPSGKTNALAHDLGAGRDFGVETALRATRRVVRTPVEVVREDPAAPIRRGFVFGMGVFTDATTRAERWHAVGLFGGLAVGAALASASARVLFGGASDPWRAGHAVRLAADGGPAQEEARFLLLLSTLERLPLGLRPFGPERPGLKLLDVAAPPRRLASALPLILSGRDRPWLAAAGYRRTDVERVRLSSAAPFILDGELFEGGELLIRRGAPVTFVAP